MDSDGNQNVEQMDGHFGDTIKVACLLWLSYSFGWRKSAQNQKEVWINNFMCTWFGITPRTRTRALDRLAEAGLIEWITRGSGKTPTVRLIFTRHRKAKV